MCLCPEFDKNANSIGINTAMLVILISLATIGVCVFCAVTSVAALFIFGGKVMKTVRSVILIVLVVLVSFYVASCGAEETDPGTLFAFALYEDEEELYYIIEEYIGSAKKITIPSEYNGIPVRAIGDHSFSGKGLKSVSIEEGIVRIGACAFAQNTELERISLPESVEIIGAGAFEDLYYELEQVVLPKGLKSLGENAFMNCSSLKEIIIPGGVNTIESGTFVGCSSLRKVEILDGVQKVDYAFGCCPSLQEIIIPSSVKEFHEDNFDQSDESLKSIQYGGKEDVWKNLKVNIPKNCTVVFHNNDSQNIPLETVLVDNVKPSTGLRLELNENGTYYRIIGVSELANKNVVIPDTYKGLPVKEIADKAFDGCSYIETVTMPESVITVGNSVFYGCNKLTSVSMPGVIQIDKGVFTGCSTIKNLTIPADFVGYVKSQPLENITITCVGITNIYASAFEGHKSLKKVTIMQGITEIGEKAFSECEMLETVLLPQDLLIIGQSAFESCTLLKDIALPLMLEKIYLCAFKKCTSLMDIAIPGSVATIGDGVFYQCSALQNVTMENGITSIGTFDDLTPGVFEGCNIKEIVIPESVTYINQSAFLDNPLESAVFKNTVGWKIGSSMYNFLAKDIILSKKDLSDPRYAASILLQLSGSDFNYMSCN